MDNEQIPKSVQCLRENKKIIRASVLTKLEDIFVFSERVLAIGYYSNVNNSDSVNLFKAEKYYRQS